MAHGGRREGAGRKKALRLTDSPTAQRILAKVEAEKLWIQAIEKASKAKTTTELVVILKYLEARAYGPLAHVLSGPAGGPITTDTTHTVDADTARELTELLDRAARRLRSQVAEGDGGAGA